MNNNSLSFDTVASAYARFRPGPPQGLSPWIIDHAQLQPGAKVLEIGCGTGQATLLFKALNPDQTSIDPGERLLEICQSVCRAHAGYQFECATFENYNSSFEAFDLIYAATSFHWVEAAVGYRKVASLLKPGAHFAVIVDRPAARTGFFTDVQSVYQRHAPELKKSSLGPQLSEPEADVGLELVARTSFSRVIHYTADEYVGLLGTFSDHIALGDNRLAALQKSVRNLINKKYSGRVEKPLLTDVSLYRRIT
ncbi:trans-aconitate 2-methyltransferase [Gilvimarinus sp. DA14]|uniref:class I SAM-dependent methyltransferase n=1 Tax=Gilvimarinus sp. DA14 TaxID=2956798 RepID=UPI0020B855A6|nr:class I SAM-dependent methyltransferase [Gilvimarinus sp. DA14]UTF60115.1 class I SAM-dependent methyltransferase [Gilvimarinus sp. DA14]